MRYDEFADHVDYLFVKPEDWVGKWLHAAVGISGEIQECLNRFDAGEGMDWDNLIEECGDTLFYIQALCLHTGTSLESLMPVSAKTDNLHQTCREAVVAAGKVLDAVKKVWVYNKIPCQKEMDASLSVLLGCIVAFSHYAGVMVPQLMQMNYDKLKKRYPAGYTDKAAQDRADKAGEQ